MFGHKSESQLFFSSVDENGLSANAIIDTVVKPGTTLLVTKTKDRAHWAHFTCTSGAAIQPWGRNFSVRLNGKGKEIKDDTDVTVMFNVTAPASMEDDPRADRLEELMDTVGKMKKDITALKSQLTKLKNGNGK